jgi:pimeloyl-ACP methyl ester carboxylesterase
MTGQTTAEQISATAAFDKTFTHHTVTVNGVRLHYVIGGKGDPVVLLHGFPETWRAWRKIMPALAEHYTVIVPDMRGLGNSSKPASGYDKKTVAEDIYQLIHQLGFGHIHLVGHDWGSAVAYAYTAAHREDVRRLVMMEILLPGFGYEEMMDMSRPGGIWHFAFHVASDDTPEVLVEGKERLYISRFIKTLSYNPEAISEAEIDEYARSYSEPGAMRAGFAYYRAVFEDAKHNKEYGKTKLKMPVLTLRGSSDGDRLAKTMQLLADNVRSVTIKNAGHWIAEEQPEELTQQLFSFFAEEK